MITDIKTMKANVLHIIILAIFSLMLTCCNKALDDNAVYVEDDASPVKSVRTPYIFQPVPLESVNGIVTVEENNDMPSTDTQHYNLVIINSHYFQLKIDYKIFTYIYCHFAVFDLSL